MRELEGNSDAHPECPRCKLNIRERLLVDVVLELVRSDSAIRHPKHEHCELSLSALRARLEAAEADTALLDWAESNRVEVEWSEDFTGPACDIAWMDGKLVCGGGYSLRDALRNGRDIARESSNEGSNGND